MFVIVAMKIEGIMTKGNIIRVVYLAIFVVSGKIQEIKRLLLYFYLLAANLFIAMKDH